MMRKQNALRLVPRVRPMVGEIVHLGGVHAGDRTLDLLKFPIGTGQDQDQDQPIGQRV